MDTILFVDSYATPAFVLMLIVLTLCIIYLLFNPYYLVRKSGLLYPRPIYPVFGHQLSLMKHGFQICYCNWRNQLYPPKNSENVSSKEVYKIYAVCEGLNCTVVVSDPLILKLVFVRDFHTFPNRRLLILHQKCLTKAVIAQPYREWKINRQNLVGTFTTSMIKQMLVDNVRCTLDLVEKAGSMTEDSLNLSEGLPKKSYKMSDDESYTKQRNHDPKISAEKIIDSSCQSKQQNTRYPFKIDGKTPFETKPLFGIYAIDIMTRNSFGFKLKFGTRDHAKFMESTREIFTYQMHRFIILSWLKPIVYLISCLLRISFVGEPSLIYIRDVIRKFAGLRQDAFFNRKDLYQIMLNAAKRNFQNERRDNSLVDRIKGCPFVNYLTKSDNKNMIDYDMENVEANSIFITLATYETLSTALSWVVYHLAQNPGMQDLIYQEIVAELGSASLHKEDETNMVSSVSNDDDSEILMSEHDSPNRNSRYDKEEFPNSEYSKVNYHFLKRLKYTDMFVKEVLRHDPPVAIINRVANEDYTLPLKDSRIKILKGTLINVPIYDIHHDPEYWPDPDIFDPERFSIENSYNKYAYLPFGLGPRNCAAEKYAMLTMKTFLAVVLQKVEFRKCPKTLDSYTPYETAFQKSEFHYPECGIWLVAHPRV
ncbi:unnamed protein product [Gordionus sp. m RMFG-2023]|uniref:cytochrome P450 3A24-like n=1 Tax=Gordionus sp. m RMFG-2023 TaxID=3053472 RepID=UPI0030DDFE78